MAAGPEKASPAIIDCKARILYASPSCLRIRLILSRRSCRSSSPSSSRLYRSVASRRMIRKRSASSTLVLLKGLPPLGQASGCYQHRRGLYSYQQVYCLNFRLKNQ